MLRFSEGAGKRDLSHLLRGHENVSHLFDPMMMVSATRTIKQSRTQKPYMRPPFSHIHSKLAKALPLYCVNRNAALEYHLNMAKEILWSNLSNYERSLFVLSNSWNLLKSDLHSSSQSFKIPLT